MDIKLKNFKDILLLWKKWLVVFVLVFISLFSVFSILNKYTKKHDIYTAKAVVSLNMYNNGVLDYNTSVKLANNYDSLNIQNSLKDKLAKITNAQLPSGLTLSISQTTDTNLLNATSTFANSSTAIQYANALAELFIQNNGKIFIDGLSNNIEHNQKIVFNIEQTAENSNFISGEPYPLKRRLIIGVSSIFFIAILAITLEMLRTNINTSAEAKNASGIKLHFTYGLDKSIMLLPKPKHDYNKDIEIIYQSITNSHGDNAKILFVLLKNTSDDIAKNLHARAKKSTRYEYIDHTNIKPNCTNIPNLPHIAVAPSYDVLPEILNIAQKYDCCILQFDNNAISFEGLQNIITTLRNSNIHIYATLINY